MSIHHLVGGNLASCIYAIWEGEIWSKALCQQRSETDGIGGTFSPSFISRWPNWLFLCQHEPLTNVFVGWFIAVWHWLERKTDLPFFFKGYITRNYIIHVFSTLKPLLFCNLLFFALQSTWLWKVMLKIWFTSKFGLFYGHDLVSPLHIVYARDFASCCRMSLAFVQAACYAPVYKLLYTIKWCVHIRRLTIAIPHFFKIHFTGWRA